MSTSDTLFTRRLDLHRRAKALVENEVIEGFTRCQSKNGKAGYAIKEDGVWTKRSLKATEARLADLWNGR